ncbi:MAG: FkbM family methyltransferase [Sphingobium sp.]
MLRALYFWLRGLARLPGDYGRRGSLAATVRHDLLLPASLRRADRARNEALIRGRCATVPLPGNDALCWCLGRYRMFVATDDIGFSTFMMRDGYWELPMTEAVVAALRPGMHVVDCGANLGYYSLLAADLIGESGRLHAFEPNPDVARRLRQSISVNGFAGRTTVHEIALADAPGAAAFTVPMGEPKNGHVGAVGSHAAEGGDGLRRFDVRVDRLDAILGDAPVDLIKIDVEGAEERLWDGMRGILARGAPLTIFLEFTPDRYADPAAFLNRIAAAGFALARITERDGVVATSRAEILAAPGNRDQMLVLIR